MRGPGATRRAVLLLILLVALLAAPVLAQKKRAVRRAALRGQLTSIRHKVRTARAALSQARRSEETIAQDLDRVESRLTVTRGRLDEAKARLAVTQREQGRVQEALQRSQTELSAQERHLAERLAASYRQGPVRYVSVLLGARSMGEFVGRAQLIRAILRYDAQLIAQIKANRERVMVWKRQVDARAQEAKQRRLDLALQQDEESQVVLQRRDLLAEAQVRRAEIARELADLEEDSETIAQRLRQAEQTVEGRVRRAVRFSGQFQRPADGPIVSSFGMRFHPILRRSRLHAGVDIGAGYGSAIRAAAEGVVVFAGQMRGYGNVVVVDHGGGVSTLYAHCSALLVSDGQHVNAGQQIARVGATGLATGPHLHFEVRHSGTPVDPMGAL